MFDSIAMPESSEILYSQSSSKIIAFSSPQISQSPFDLEKIECLNFFFKKGILRHLKKDAEYYSRKSNNLDKVSCSTMLHPLKNPPSSLPFFPIAFSTLVVFNSK